MTYGLADVVQQRRLIELSGADETYKRLSTAKLDAMLGLAEAADCRRVRLLAYFGEESPPCGNCDNCLAPPQVRDASEDARKLLSCIYRCRQASGFGFAATHIVDVLRGRLTDKVKKFGHHELSTFGIGADVAEAEWRLLLRQLVAQHLVDVDYERFNVLRLTESSRAVLRGSRRIELRRQAAAVRARPKKSRPQEASRAEVALGVGQAAVFERLRDWRAQVARAHGVPAYVVFHDSTLRAIAQARPASPEALRAIPGLGERKLANYGAELLAIVAAAS
jgi:ATP-dependent DNA helicase RecQ